MPEYILSNPIDYIIIAYFKSWPYFITTLFYVRQITKQEKLFISRALGNALKIITDKENLTALPPTAHITPNQAKKRFEIQN